MKLKNNINTMKKSFLALALIVQFVAVGCSQTVEIDAIEQDEAYLEQHNEMSAEETADTIGELQADGVETATVDPVEGEDSAVQSN